MRQIVDDFTDPADHLAMDEALLVAADEGDSGEAIRFWQFSELTIIAGRSTPIKKEIDTDYCDAQSIPVLRRCSGGATVVGGPGCLMYSVVLALDADAPLRKIDVAHEYVMSRLLNALQQQLPDIRWQGICDLTWNNRKCSGNSLKIARHHLLYHGTILFDFRLDVISKALKLAPRQPDYRQGRDHHEFITNIPIEPGRFIQDATVRFGVEGQVECDSYLEQIQSLRAEKYDDPKWHYRH